MILNLRIVCFIDTFSEIIYYLKFMIISRHSANYLIKYKNASKNE